jgi:hypothetical protein
MHRLTMAQWQIARAVTYQVLKKTRPTIADFCVIGGWSKSRVHRVLKKLAHIGFLEHATGKHGDWRLGHNAAKYLEGWGEHELLRMWRLCQGLADKKRRGQELDVQATSVYGDGVPALLVDGGDTLRADRPEQS